MIKPSILVLVIGLCANSALAQGFEASIVDQLRREGYADIRLNTTFLGRVRILALGDKGQREIVINPRTGEVLRDLWQVAPAGGGGSVGGGSVGGGQSGPAPQGPANDDRGRNGGDDDRPSDDGGDDDNSGSDDSGSDDSSSGGDDDGGQGRGRGRGGDDD